MFFWAPIRGDTGCKHHRQKYGLGSASVPIVNTTILGAFSKGNRDGRYRIDHGCRARECTLHPENNAKAALEAYEKVVLLKATS